MSNDDDKPKVRGRPFVAGHDPRRTIGKARRNIDGKAITEIAREHTEKAINVLVEIMMRAKAKDRDRIAAANQLLNRGWGLPNVSFRHDVNVNHSMVASLDPTKLSPEVREQILAAQFRVLDDHSGEAVELENLTDPALLPVSEKEPDGNE